MTWSMIDELLIPLCLCLLQLTVFIKNSEEFKCVIYILGCLCHFFFSKKLCVLCLQHQRAGGTTSYYWNTLFLIFGNNINICICMGSSFIKITCYNQWRTAALEAVIHQNPVAIGIHYLNEGYPYLRIICIYVAAWEEENLFTQSLRLLDALKHFPKIGGGKSWGMTLWSNSQRSHHTSGLANGHTYIGTGSAKRNAL